MILEKIRQRASENLQHIILPEGEDARTVQAAEICVKDKIAKITIIGNEEKVRELARETGSNLNGVEILDHRKSADFGKIATFYHELRRAKGVTLEEAEQISVIKRIFNSLFGFFKRNAFRPSQFVIKRGDFAKICGLSMVENLHAVQI